jgi:membrane protease YdiL (CAAX protease family)
MTVWPPPTTAPAGWYHDPSGSLRYFDGRVWAPLTAGAPGFDNGPGRGERRELPLLPLRAAIGGLAVILASLLIARAIVGVLLGADLPFAVYVGILIALGYGPALVYSLWAVKRWGTGSVIGDLGLRPRFADLGWGVVLWVSAIFAQLVTAVILLVLAVPTGSNVEGIEAGGLDRTYVVVLLVSAVIAAPVVEEVLFRGVILPAFLGSMPAALALGLQGVLFGVVHFDPELGAGNLGLVVVLSVVGLVLGVGTWLLRRLLPAIIAHAIFNGVVMVLVLSGVLDNLEAYAHWVTA